MSSTDERPIGIEAVRIPIIRDVYGELTSLGTSIRDGGMHRPLILWKDGTLISGSRRHRAAYLLGRKQIIAVFVDTIEDAAQLLLGDQEHDEQALPLKHHEICRIWQLLRKLDEPAAAIRKDAARRLGVELRRQTQAGQRPPGRTASRTEDYVLHVVAPAFGMSETTAKRLWAVYMIAYLMPTATDERREQARASLAAIDAGESSISREYAKLISNRTEPVMKKKAVAPVVPPAETSRQVTAWNRSLPQMEGLVAGLIELGPPNPELTWEQVGPVHTRLMAVRRELEKIIKKMRESNQS